MRALFILPNLATGGQERQWSILLPGLRRRGVDARLIALDGGGPFEQSLRESEVPLEVLHMRHQLDLPAAARSRLLRDFTPDVVVTCGVSGMYVGAAIARWRRAAQVYNEHRQVGMVLSRRRESMVRLIARRLDLVIAVSEGQASAWLKRRYPPQRIVVVPNGVPAPDGDVPRSEARRELGLGDDDLAALLVATLRPEKRVGDFVEALGIARSIDPRIVGLIAGAGPGGEAVARAAAAEPGVRLLGHVDDVDRLLRAADMFVLSSEYEALPMSILEALAAGVPVVSTAVGDIPDLIEDGETGFLVAPRAPAALADRLVQLAADPELRARMGAMGARRHAERWDAELMIDRYLKVLEELAQRRGGRLRHGE
jgi:glycosyltransferase involved in cell wall biosynthesis